MKFMLAGMGAGLAAVLLIGGAFLLGREFADDDDPETVSAEPRGGAAADAGDFAVLEEIYSLLEDDFLRPGDVDRETLRQAAINGMIEVLGDRNTIYIDPESLARGAGDSSGLYEGIGASVSQDPESGEIVIVQPFSGSPAREAGVEPGDVLTDVNGESTQGWTVDQAVAVIRGPRGSEVTITVRHLDGDEETFTIERNEIEIQTVHSCPGAELGDDVSSDNDLNSFGLDCPLAELDGDEAERIAYLKIDQFAGTAPDDVEAALEEIRAGDYEGLIVDLRNNPGGLVTATVEISDMFLEEGQIFREVDSDGNEQVFDASGSDLAEGMPIVVLVNEFSASGSEVFAAALQQNDRAYVIGDTTFGKGTVNVLRQLSDGGGLYVSIAQWFAPDGERIDTIGVEPNLKICPNDEDLDELRDVQMQAAIDHLQDELDPDDEFVTERACSASREVDPDATAEPETP